jgi:hypothetical protein
MLQKAVPALKVDPERVLMVSGRDAFLARLVLRNRAETDRLEDFGNLYYGRNGANTVKQKPSEELARDAQDLLTESGMEQMESTLFEYLLANGRKFELGDRLAKAREQTQAFLNYIEMQGAGLQMGQLELRQVVERIQRDLDEVPALFSPLKELGKRWIQKFDEDFALELNRLKETLESLIDETITAAPSVRALGLSYEDPKPLEVAIQQINTRVLSQVGRRFERFRKELYLDASRKYTEMSYTFSQEALKVSKAIERSVRKPLKIKLSPLAFTQEPIDQTQFEENITQSIAKIVEKKDWQRTEYKEERTGFCGLGTPKKVPLARSGSHYVLTQDALKSFWVDQVNEWSEHTLGTIKVLIRSQVKAQVGEVTTKLESYISNFQVQMNRLLEQNQGTLLERQERMVALDRTRTQLNDLLSDLTACAEQLSKG